MSRSIVYQPPGPPPYQEPRYSILECRPPGPWHTNRVSMEMTDLDEAVRTAQARIQWEHGLIVRVVDRQGVVHWTNEEQPHAPDVPPSGLQADH